MKFAKFAYDDSFYLKDPLGHVKYYDVTDSDVDFFNLNRDTLIDAEEGYLDIVNERAQNGIYQYAKKKVFPVYKKIAESAISNDEILEDIYFLNETRDEFAETDEDIEIEKDALKNLIKESIRTFEKYPQLLVGIAFDDNSLFIVDKKVTDVILETDNVRRVEDIFNSMAEHVDLTKQDISDLMFYNEVTNSFVTEKVVTSAVESVLGGFDWNGFSKYLMSHLFELDIPKVRNVDY